MAIEIKTFETKDVSGVLGQISDLAGEFFKGFPYLKPHNKDLDLKLFDQIYNNERSIVICAFDGSRMIGANLAAEFFDYYQSYFNPYSPWMRKYGYSTDNCLIEPLLVVDQEYHSTGLGIGLVYELDRQMLSRNKRARFAEHVVRPINHPKAPPRYSPTFGFSKKYGFEKIMPNGLITTWTDVGETEPTDKIMDLIIKKTPGWTP